jgi:hypothetical protein
VNITLFKLTCKQLEVALYATTAWRGVINAWAQRKTNYKRGFVVRVLVFGFVLRVGHNRVRNVHSWIDPLELHEAWDQVF